MKRYCLLLCLLLMVTLSHAQALTRPDSDTIKGWGQADYILLGEVHDNAKGHALRLEWIKELIKEKKFALALEQLNANNQSTLDGQEKRLFSEHSPYSDKQLRALAVAGGFTFKGWHWPFYAPLFNLALTQQLPLIATNLDEHQMMRIMMGQEGLIGLPPNWTENMTQDMQNRVEKGHCNMLPQEMLSPMAEAQISRDQAVAKALVEARHTTHLPVILLAGNGHLRNDLAVPFWLREFDPQAKVLTIAVMEAGNEDNEPAQDFNGVYFVDAQDRKDPCEELKQHRFTMPHQKQ